MHKTWRVKSPLSSEGVNLDKARSEMGLPPRLRDLGKANSERSVEWYQRAKLHPSGFRVRW